MLTFYVNCCIIKTMMKWFILYLKKERANIMKINVLKAIREYEDDQARILEEMMEQDAHTDVSAENDPLWDCWYQLSYMYEPTCDKDTEEDVCDKQEDTISYRMPSKNRAKRAERRKATAMHKKKIGRNVSAIWSNYGKRMVADMQNWSYQKLKDGEKRTNPKSQEDKADKIFKKAMRVNAIPEHLLQPITEHMEWLSEYGKRNIEAQLSSDRYYRECEAKVKSELDALVKANINIFVQRTSLERNLILNGNVA